MSKFRLFGRDKLQDHTCLMKEKERRKRKSEEEEKRKRRKSNGGVLSFYNGYFGEKKQLDVEGPFGGNVFKNPALYR